MSAVVPAPGDSQVEPPVHSMPDERRGAPAANTSAASGGDGRSTPVSPAGDTPPDQDSEPPRTADDGSEEQSGEAPPSTHPASPGALH